MIKLIIGKKGSGKTKTLIDLVNTALNTSKGSVVCIEKGDKLKFDINYRCRLIDSDEYLVTDAEYLYGFIAGILASDHDVTDIFVDSALKICQNDVSGFDKFLNNLYTLVKTHNVNCVLTSSIAVEDATDTMRKFTV